MTFKASIEEHIRGCHLKFDIILSVPIWVEEEFDHFLLPCIAVSLCKGAPNVLVKRLDRNVEVGRRPEKTSAGAGAESEKEGKKRVLPEKRPAKEESISAEVGIENLEKSLERETGEPG